MIAGRCSYPHIAPLHRGAPNSRSIEMTRLVQGILAVLALTTGMIVAATGATAHAVGAVNKPALHLHHGTHGGAHNGTSGNWSGYAVTGGTFNSVSGTWTVPTVNCNGAATGGSSTWVGLDGDGNSTVEQLGTTQDCLWGGASYSAWYELYPQAEIGLPSKYTVNPGDVIHAWTQYINTKDEYWFHMQNRTRGWTWDLYVASPTSPRPTNTSAEWIEEQYSCFYTCSWLANFGTVTFTEAVASRPSAPQQPISAFPYDAISMVDGSGVVKAQPSALSATSFGSKFSVTFLHS
jgi:hypothetical protein